MPPREHRQRPQIMARPSDRTRHNHLVAYVNDTGVGSLREHMFYAQGVAGCGHGRGSSIPLKDRRRGGAPTASATSQEGVVRPSVRHVWVAGDDGVLPGLLLRWRQVASGWQGYVTHPVRDAQGWALIDEWLPAERLQPVQVAPPPGSGPEPAGTATDDRDG